MVTEREEALQSAMAEAMRRAGEGMKAVGRQMAKAMKATVNDIAKIQTLFAELEAKALTDQNFSYVVGSFENVLLKMNPRDDDAFNALTLALARVKMKRTTMKPKVETFTIDLQTCGQCEHWCERSGYVRGARRGYCGAMDKPKTEFATRCKGRFQPKPPPKLKKPQGYCGDCSHFSEYDFGDGAFCSRDGRECNPDDWCQHFDAKPVTFPAANVADGTIDAAVICDGPAGKPIAAMRRCFICDELAEDDGHEEVFIDPPGKYRWLCSDCRTGH